MMFGRSMVSANGHLNVRASTSTTASILFTMKQNEVATILTSTGNWYKIEHPEGTGYVSKDYFVEVPDAKTTITVKTSSGNLNIRSGPDTSFPIVFRAANGSALNLYEEGSSFSLVSNGSQIGWGSNDYLVYQGGNVPGNHRNADYTEQDILNGTGVWYNDGSKDYSPDVYQLQINLSKLGYKESRTGVRDGRGIYGEYTERDVREFQYNVYGITQKDGKVGKKTLGYIQQALSNGEYFFHVGAPLDETEWGQDVIASGSITAIDALARVIYAEESKENCQRLAARVIKERTTSSYIRSVIGGDKWLGVLSYIHGGGAPAFSTANASNTNARRPQRSRTNESGLNPQWKNAVDLAKKLVNEETITLPTLYALNGTSYTGKIASYSGQLNFKAKEKYDITQNAQNAICLYSSKAAAEEAENTNHIVAYDDGRV